MKPSNHSYKNPYPVGSENHFAYWLFIEKRSYILSFIYCVFGSIDEQDHEDVRQYFCEYVMTHPPILRGDYQKDCFIPLQLFRRTCDWLNKRKAEKRGASLSHVSSCDMDWCLTYGGSSERAQFEDRDQLQTAATAVKQDQRQTERARILIDAMPRGYGDSPQDIYACLNEHERKVFLPSGQRDFERVSPQEREQAICGQISNTWVPIRKRLRKKLKKIDEKR